MMTIDKTNIIAHGSRKNELKPDLENNISHRSCPKGNKEVVLCFALRAVYRMTNERFEWQILSTVQEIARCKTTLRASRAHIPRGKQRAAKEGRIKGHRGEVRHPHT